MKFKETTLNLLLVLTSLLVGVYIVEVFLSQGAFRISFRSQNSPLAQTPPNADRRTSLELMTDLRRSGRNPIPNILPHYFLETDGAKDSRGMPIFPLSTLPLRENVLCNEGGQWITFNSDENGFNNPPGLHRPGELDIALVGDSLTEGNCVPPEATIAAQLRKGVAPAKPFPRTLTLGKAASGPLIELAILREYASPLKPRTLVWLYYEHNDLGDLLNESKSALLTQYLTPGFSQKLALRRQDVHEVLVRFLNEKTSGIESRFEPVDPASQTRSGMVSNLFSAAKSVAKLTQIRLRFGLVLHRFRSEKIYGRESIEVFRQILTLARDEVRDWGGQMVFVYLPGVERYLTPFSALGDVYRTRVLDLAHSLEMPVVDIHEVFSANPDPAGYFILRRGHHYTEEGYSLVARAIAETITHTPYYSAH